MSYKIMEACNGCGACVRLCPADAVSGERKKLHVIAEDLCIECGACGRICPRAAVLNGGGMVCVAVKRSEWPKPELVIEECTACGICVDACPVGCLQFLGMPVESGGHVYPCLKDSRACIGCGFCSIECPSDALVMKRPVKSTGS